MTTCAKSKALHFYPERFYSASPTYNSWVKITAAGVHALRPAPSPAEAPISRTDNFSAPHPTFFHLNHPIRFIRLVGTVVAIDDLAPRFVLVTLDDGSGATLELKVTRIAPTATGPDGIARPVPLPVAAASTTTTAANVTVDSGLGHFALLVDGTPLDIGSTIKAKCTLGTFRGTMQGALQRCWVLCAATSTRVEAEAWAETAEFAEKVLARPWVLDGEQLAKLERRAARVREEERREERKRGERARRKEEVGRDRREKSRLWEERREVRRKKDEVAMDEGALV